MKYACLVYNDEGKLDALSEEQLAATMHACNAWVAELEEGGYRFSCTALQSVRTATTVRVRNGKLSLTDGPFAETKEQLGGLTLIEARDLNEAIQIAARLPAARLGSVEVRPLLEPGAEYTTAFDRRIAGAMERSAK
jgi:hypothetical protein